VEAATTPSRSDVNCKRGTVQWVIDGKIKKHKILTKIYYLSPEYFEKIFIRLCVIQKFYVPLQIQ